MRTAIIGMACLFPGAPGLARYWQNIVDGVDAISEVPPNRWEPEYFDPISKSPDRFYCKRGGFIDEFAHFDPLPFGIMPKAASAAEPDQLLTLQIGYDALRDAGYADKAFARERTGVIIGRGNSVSAGALRLQQRVRLVPQILQTLQDLFPEMPEATLATIRARLQAGLSDYGPDVATGLIPNLLASRLANRLDLHGPAYTIDAACASSLLAVEQACGALHRRDADMMLVGGVHLTHDVSFWATFCQLGALSRSGTIRPFSQQADGILAGEGIGIVVLKRLDDALAAGDRIYAVVEATGSSSDGRSNSLVAPSSKGQQIALDRAWAELPFTRDDLGLLEAHGTGTPVGDEAELQTLAHFFGGHVGEQPRAVLGSVKSMIGHAMPAAGMASLIKTALAIHHGILPPTLHCESPHPRLADTRFRVVGKAETWPQAREQRIAAINGFGFGGINAHVVLRGLPARAAVQAAAILPRLLVLSADTVEELLARFDRGEHDALPQPGGCRLVMQDPTEKRRATARRALLAGKPWPGRQHIWFSPRGLLRSGGKLAFVFPGVDSRFAPQATDLATHFQRPLPRLCETLDPSQSLAQVSLALFGFNRYMAEILHSLNIAPDAYAGHSIGEWSAMTAAGVLTEEVVAHTYESFDPASARFPNLQFVAAGCSEATLQRAMDGLSGIALSHDNCPHQVIACGEPKAAATVVERLRGDGVFAQVLPIASGFHSPLLRGYLKPFADLFSATPMQAPAKPLWSATTAQPYPSSQRELQTLAVRHLLEPVRFRSMIEAMHADGCRVFVQVGTGSLPGFINDTLGSKPHLALHSNVETRSGLAQLQAVCAALWVEGAEIDTALLRDTASADQALSRPVTTSTQKLELGVPFLRLHEPLPSSLLPAQVSTDLPTLAANDAIGQAVRETLLEIERAGRDVLTAWQRHRQSPAAIQASEFPRFARSVQRQLDIQTTIPWVQDHCFFPQREGWPIIEDRQPVVPLTMEVLMVRDAALALLAELGHPQLKIIEVGQIQAHNWLEVSQPVTIEIRLQSAGDGLIDAEIVGYFKAQLRVASEFPTPADAAPAPLLSPRAPLIAASDIYRRHYMFHGPAYQGVVGISAVGDNGIDGELRTPPGQGALLDNMAQLAGYWVQEQPEDCLAMPIGANRIRFFADDPAPGSPARAHARTVHLDASTFASDLRLYDVHGNLCIAVDGWQTRRYKMDNAFWRKTAEISHREASQQVPPNVAIFEDHYDTAIIRDFIARRFLTLSERKVYNALPPRRRRHWLNGRVAGKDAVRAYLRNHFGTTPMFPQECVIDNDASGAPKLRGNISNRVPEHLHISLTHKESFAAAIVSDRPVGIDLERIAPRDAGFVELVFSEPECQLLIQAQEDSASAYTRGWVAKEVAAKAAGTGFGGNPKNFVIEQRDGDCFCVNGHWVVTHRLREYIVGWSLDLRAQTAQQDPLIARQSLL